MSVAAIRLGTPAGEPVLRFRPQLTAPVEVASSLVLAARVGPSLAGEVAYISGVDASGRITSNSYWSAFEGVTAFKFGAPTAGAGATISYAFDPASGFGGTEQATFERALASWSAVANVRFVRSDDAAGASILLHRGTDGLAYTDGAIASGSGSTLGHRTQQALISIDTSVDGFDLSGSLDRVGGYGFATAIHEIGHAIGLGHGGAYNFTADPATDQFSVYDDTIYSTMSYFNWSDPDLKYGLPPAADTYDWGTSADGYYRVSPHTAMQADIMAVQALYGASRQSPFSTPKVFGFGSTVTGPLATVYDFADNPHPVVTLYSTAVRNTLDVSGFGDRQRIDLTPGAVSDVGGLYGNLLIAAGTWIDDCVGGDNIDRITGNEHANRIDGRGDGDTLFGEGGADVLIAGDSSVLSGGTGDDRYYLVSGSVDERNGDGFDRVVCSGYRCDVSDGVEVLTFTAAIGCYGEAGNTAITMYGAAGDDILRSGLGADKLVGGAGDDALLGFGGSDQLLGGIGADTLFGERGDDVLVGGDGADQLRGDVGADTLNGGLGADRMEGGLNDDHYFVESIGDVVLEVRGGGRDLVTASVAFTLPDYVEDLQLAGHANHGTGNALANLLTGGAGGDYLFALDGTDTLHGMAGGDRLDGGAGNDVLTGGLGADLLVGGVGLDRFVFLAGDSGPGLAASDRIDDFSQSQHDRIDLSGLALDAALTFVGTQAFSGAAGEVRYAFSGALTFVTADLDGDRIADFGLRLTGQLALVGGDFILAPAAPDLV